MRRIARSSLVFLCLAAGLAGACRRAEPRFAGEWPRFRGPSGNGLLEGAAAPKRWGPDSPNILWQTRVPGAGNSSPVVSGGRVFLTTTYGDRADDPQAVVMRAQLHRVVVALDLETGEMLWETPLYHGNKGAAHWINTQAAPTPATDGELLFVSFDSRLAALDFEGEIVWQKDLDPTYLEHSEYGASSSVVLTGDAVILMRDREGGGVENPGWIVALDKKTGEELWRDEWMHTCCSYTTPLLVERGGRSELLHSSSSEIVGLDPETGERLWLAEHPVVQPVPSVLLEGDLLVSPGAIHDKAITVFRLSGEGAETKIEPLWQRRQSVPEIASPILYMEKLFTVTEGGIMVAYRPHDGRRLWTARLPAGTYRASPVAADERIYLPTEEGLTAVVSAKSKSYRLLAENELPEGSTASPALSSHCLLLRTASQLYCIAEERRRKTEGGEGEPPSDAAR